MTQVSMYAFSAPTFARMLRNLSAMLAKAEAHAKAKNFDPAVLLNDRLAPDMFTLTRQVQIATDHAKGAMARLAGKQPEVIPDTDTTIADLQARRRTPAELGLFGASLGGTTAIFAAAQDPERFEVVMAESAFVRLDWAAEDRMPPILRPGVIFLGERLAGRSSASINCEQQVCALKGRRVLLFHSKGDRTVWERHADRFEELLGVEVERMEGPHARLTHTRADYFADRFDEQWPATHAEEQSARASAN